VARKVHAAIPAALVRPDPKSETRYPKSLASLFLCLLLFVPACAGRRRPLFVPAAAAQAEAALAAWRSSVAQADISPARLLYDARISQGPFRVSGALAVRAGSRSLDATLSGPFGDSLARYSDGVFTGKGLRTIAIEEEELRWMLAGAWKGGEPPAVAGIAGGEALLRWSGPEQVEGVLDVAGARLRSLEVKRKEGGIRADYPDGASGRPRRIELEDLKSGNVLKLTLIAAEPLND
jgi:hypothetical protein